MATDKAISVDQLSKDERAVVVDALYTFRAVKERAAKATSDAEMVELLSRRVAAIDSLITRFR